MKKIVITILVVFAIFFVTINTLSEEKIVNKNTKIKDSSLAIMVYDESKKDYVKQATFPKGRYELSSESYCENGTPIGTYDSENGTIITNFKKSDKCYYFFDKELIFLATYIINDVYNSDENKEKTRLYQAGLYKHDASLPNGAGDDTYRYAGADGDVNNWVCFEGDDCTNENNLYRIISVDSSGVTKIIKATSLTNKWQWNNKTGYTATGTTEDTTMGLTTGTTYINIWAIKQADGSYYTSSLNDYLNGEYLTNMETKTNLIETTTWSVGGASYDDISKKNVHDFMIEEEKGTYDAKIGLVCASDYGFAALPGYWERKLYYNDIDGYNASLGNDWMLSNFHEWTISRVSDYTNYTFYLISGFGDVRYNGAIYWNLLRPVFGLSSSAKLKNDNAEGVGSKANPMIIEAKKSS